MAVPATATQNAKARVCALNPRGTVAGRALVAIMPNILAPFVDIAAYVVEPPRVGPLLPDGTHPSIVGPRPCVARQLPGVVPKVEPGGGAGTAGVLPFGLAGEGESPPGLLVQLLEELLAVIPARLDRKLRSLEEARVGVHYGFPLLLRDLVLPNVEALRDRHVVCRRLAGDPVLLDLSPSPPHGLNTTTLENIEALPELGQFDAS